MRVQDEHSWEAEYWDDYIKEFGVGAYVKARYEDAGDNLRSCYDTPESWSHSVGSLAEGDSS